MWQQVGVGCQGGRHCEELGLEPRERGTVACWGPQQQNAIIHRCAVLSLSHTTSSLSPSPACLCICGHAAGLPARLTPTECSQVLLCWTGALLRGDWGQSPLYHLCSAHLWLPTGHRNELQSLPRHTQGRSWSREL